MPIQFISPPAEGDALVNEQLDAFERRRRPYVRHPEAVALGKHKIGPDRPRIKAMGHDYAPLPVYTVNIRDLLPGGRGLDGAQPWGFYYVLENRRGHPCARAHLITAEDGRLRVASLSFGTHSRDTIPALKKLLAHPRLKSGLYEARSLRCKEMFLAAIWLTSNTGEDLIYPLEAKHHFLPEELPYSVGRFLAALQPLAERYRKAYQAFRSSGNGASPSAFAP